MLEDSFETTELLAAMLGILCIIIFEVTDGSELLLHFGIMAMAIAIGADEFLHNRNPSVGKVAK